MFGLRAQAHVLSLYGGITYQFKEACLGGLQKRAWQGLVIIEKRRVRREWAAREQSFNQSTVPLDVRGSGPFHRSLKGSC